MSFWNTLQHHRKPFFTIAPMADVTDVAFRQLIAKYSRHGTVGGGPDVMWTEFVSANGLMSPGRETLLVDLRYSENERPIVAQFFSADPEKMEGAAKLAAELGFDGVDINMGCPDKTIEKQGAGAAMIKSPETAQIIIRAVKRGVQATGKDIPVSVKTRVGYRTNEIETWIPLLLKEGIAALTVHARTRKDLSLVAADWEYIREIAKLRDNIAPGTVVIGNGDVISLADGKEKARMSGCDGIMVGRALFGNPWFFDEEREIVAALPQKRSNLVRTIPFLNKVFSTTRNAPNSAVRPISVRERLEVLVEHTELFEELLGRVKKFSIMKKHYKAYCTGFPGAKELRIKLMETKSCSEVKAIIKSFMNS